MRFELKSVEFYGNTIVSSDNLNKYFLHLIGKEVGFKEIVDAISDITLAYQSMGYITSKAYIPPQDVIDGVLKINILEGKIGQIDINKTKRVKSSYIKNNFIRSNNLEESKIFNVNNLKNSLNELNSTEYLKGKVILKQGNESQTTDIILDIKDRFPVNFGASTDNFGRNYTGLQRFGLNVGTPNITGFGDSLNNHLDFSKGLFGINTVYSVPVGSKGAKLQFGYSHSDIKIGQELKSEKIKGKSNDFNTKISMPLYKKNNLIINSEIGFEMLSSKTESSVNSAYNNKYELRVLRTGLNLIKEDNSGRWISSATVNTGLPFLGAKTKKEDESDATSKFVKLEGSLIRIQSLPLKSFGIFRLSGQYSPSHLLSAEQTQAGGMYSVRGYREGVLYGDLGYNLTLEARKAVPYLPSTVSVPYGKDKNIKIPVKNRIYMSVFYDQAIAREHRQGISYSYKNFLQSVGAGLNISLTKFINANMYIGVPLGRQRDDKQNSVRFHFDISSDLI
ncbi:MAG TPA: ShlB/FhaC/HecB family hemolysin secretion/activation protein [Candidatus Gastranaerophilales bacterium]|nr:ShlB/FhaC/HecB family hemolysin secretion/activation protein [Candidatus Gastranaerophilales bacterium]